MIWKIPARKVLAGEVFGVFLPRKKIPRRKVLTRKVLIGKDLRVVLLRAFPAILIYS
jgi:hypothetical protein